MTESFPRMKSLQRYFFPRLVSLMVGLWAILVWIVPSLIWASPAFGTIRYLEEAPGQQVYQSRQTLRDPQGHGWQAIAFKRIHPDHSVSVYLRLVGFPGVTEIDRSRPLILMNSMGQIMTAEEASQTIFSDSNAPEPTVGQYDLQPILAQLQAELPLHVSIPTVDGPPIQLQIPAALVQEWQTVAQYE